MIYAIVYDFPFIAVTHHSAVFHITLGSLKFCVFNRHLMHLLLFECHPGQNFRPFEQSVCWAVCRNLSASLFPRRWHLTSWHLPPLLQRECVWQYPEVIQWEYLQALQRIVYRCFLRGYVSVILIVIESTLSGIFLFLTNSGLISVKRMQTLLNGLRFRECPAAFQDLLLRLIKPHDVIPSR